ncbi:hypothetical protein [Paludisphaera mucosa]|uniref:Peptidase M10 metallopeptidase domain-containing protein n=1 Tax=Paludisphaera mucosa TaxID=3030827 RepID=A0ABT6FBN5_9BACT|nr:hypothetical protein [Paludisphaera mucosa]MDG3004952.1 hypothetical protein [Paludisphaera mucosa]
MTNRKRVLAAVLFGIGSLAVSTASAYVYCGFHDRRYQMRAYHFNSVFWVDQLVAEAEKWNRVHPVLSIDRTLSRTIPVGKDGQSVMGWLSEADLNRAYGLSWVGSVGWTITTTDGRCGRFLESDMFFNPAVTLFTPQTTVPYSLGFQEIALHELGHAVTLDHEDGGLSVMTTNNAVSDVLHHNDKVGWIRSAAQKFNPLPTPRDDMGVFPIRNGAGSKIYSTLSPATVARGADVTIQNFSVENLSSVFPFENPTYRLVLEEVSSGAATDLGTFFWGRFEPFTGWSGNLTYTVPSSVAPSQYRVVAIFQGQDGDATNDRAVFGTIRVR